MNHNEGSTKIIIINLGNSYGYNINAHIKCFSCAENSNAIYVEPNSSRVSHKNSLFKKVSDIMDEDKDNISASKDPRKKF